jgi:hypothetical protein
VVGGALCGLSLLVALPLLRVAALASDAEER